jgi:hypothetical protein
MESGCNHRGYGRGVQPAASNRSRCRAEKVSGVWANSGNASNLACVWLLFAKSVATAFVWIMFYIAKAKKIGSNIFLWFDVKEETLWRLIWMYS